MPEERLFVGMSDGVRLAATLYLPARSRGPVAGHPRDLCEVIARLGDQDWAGETFHTRRWERTYPRLLQ